VRESAQKQVGGRSRVSAVALRPVILDFENRRVVRPEHPEYERVLAAALEAQRKLVLTASRCTLPPPKQPR
jgi:hypothetical protein